MPYELNKPRIPEEHLIRNGGRAVEEERRAIVEKGAGSLVHCNLACGSRSAVWTGYPGLRRPAEPLTSVNPQERMPFRREGGF